MGFRSMFRRMFRYRESRFTYGVGSLLIKALPLPKWLVVRTPYGLVIYPKDFRALSMMFDMVEPEVQNLFEEILGKLTFLSILVPELGGTY